MADINASFENIYKESKKKSEQLRSKYTGIGAFDKVIQKIKDLNSQSSDIREQIKQTSETLEKIKIKKIKEQLERAVQKESDQTRQAVERISLMTLIENMHSIISSIQELDPTSEDNHAIEKTIQDKIALFNKNLETFKWRDSKIAQFVYGKALSEYMSYAAIGGKVLTMLGLAWFSQVGEAAERAGAIFRPISASFVTVIKLFNFLGRTVQYLIARDKEEKAGAKQRKEDNLAETKNLLQTSTLFRFASFTLNFISILAYAGVLVTPVGFACVAGATLLDWIDEEWRTLRQAEKEHQACKKTHAAAIAGSRETIELKELADRVAQARREAAWGFANVIAMALIACGPIPFAGPALGIVGLSLFGIVGIRNGYKAGKNFLADKFAASAPAAKAETETDDELASENALEKNKALVSKQQELGKSTQAHILSGIRNTPNNTNLPTPSPITSEPDQTQGNIIQPLFSPSVNNPTSNDPVIAHKDHSSRPIRGG